MPADIFLKLKGIDGESKDIHGHKNELEVESFSWGMSAPHAAHGGGGTGSSGASVHDFSFTKFADKASHKLKYHCLCGQPIDEVVITLRKQGTGDKPLDYEKYTLTEVKVTSFQKAAHAGGGVATESLSLNCAKFKYEYFEQSEKGSGKAAGQIEYDMKSHSCKA